MLFAIPVTYPEGQEPLPVTAEQVYLFIRYALTMNDHALPGCRPEGCTSAGQHTNSVITWLEARWFATTPNGQDPELQSIANEVRTALFGCAFPHWWDARATHADTPLSHYVQFLIRCVDGDMEHALLRLLYRYVAGFSEGQADTYDDLQRWQLSRAESIRRAELGRQLINSWDIPRTAEEAAEAAKGTPTNPGAHAAEALFEMLERLRGDAVPLAKTDKPKPTKH